MRVDVYEELKRQIVELDVKPGEVLHEKVLSEMFSVSRTPIREALIRLEAEGLVKVSRGRGAYVTEISLQHLKESYEIRSFLTELLGQLMVSRATEAEYAEMDALLAQIGEETAPAVLRNLDMAFHDLVNRATHNTLLAETLTRLRNQVSRVWDSNVPEGEDSYFSGIHEEFSQLVSAARAKDTKEVVRLLRRHLARFVDEIIGFSTQDRWKEAQGARDRPQLGRAEQS